MKSRWITAGVTALAALSIVGALLYNQASVQAAQAQLASRPAGGQAETVSRVEVITPAPGQYQARVTGYGEGKPHHALTLSARVSGFVASIRETFESGMRVSRGAELARLESVDYRQALATAQSELAAARVTLLEAQREAERARDEWQGADLGDTPDSPLVLKTPQLDAAKAAVTAAEQSVAQAKKNLDQTRIAAPFDALIVSREIQPGSYLQAGTAVATLYSTDRIEIAVPLSARQWEQLPDVTTLVSGDWPVTLIHSETGQQWQGYVLRVQQHVERAGRQRSLVVAVDHPLDQEAPLYPGTFVKVAIPGRMLANVWKLPASAISVSGHVWGVTAAGTLVSHDAEVVFEEGDWVYVRPVEGWQDVQIVRRPLSSYLPGMKVRPVEGGQS
ncbi:MAG: efflux RND transporter periplasmic adaptor subunit [Gammaproteobacteria bacterium]|nr:MAG: efflux RND transporter periplasmic adaptor subunit [Gammaproteobacteria bacterium]